MNDMILPGAVLLLAGGAILFLARARLQARRDFAPLLELPARIEALAAELARADGRLQMMSEAQESRLKTFGATLSLEQERLRGAVDAKLADALREAREGRLEFGQSFSAFERRLSATLAERLAAIQADNAQKLDEMRRTVDEKLHATLEQRLGQSFNLVSQRLEQVHRGLGEMQTLAAGVGDLKRVLSNVKARGTWGEVQLEALIGQILAPEQYRKNLPTQPGSNERVEFAIRFPGKEEGEPIWLPIDAKFPVEDYLRLLDAHERADSEQVETASRALEARVRAEAKSIRDKYIAPPHTTEFAVMYLPAEGLYAEVLRRPGLAESIQREHRVVLSGPTNLAALLNSLQMGFRTLAIERRSSEVWDLLGAVKTEFGKFGDVVAATQKKLEQATSQFSQVGVRTRAIQRKLRDVEALPAEDAPLLSGAPLPGEEE